MESFEPLLHDLGVQKRSTPPWGIEMIQINNITKLANLLYWAKHENINNGDNWIFQAWSILNGL